MNDREKLLDVAARLDALKADIAAHLELPPPDPVDCVLSEWSDWEPVGDWGPCRPDRTQVRTERRTRTVVVEAANGGAACDPIREETREVTQPCVYVPPVVDPVFELPTKEQLMSWDTLPEGFMLGRGYREDRHVIESQGHEFLKHDPSLDQRHFHLKISKPLVSGGIIPFHCELTFFHCWNLVMTGLTVTLRGGGSVLYPSPAKPDARGVWNLPIDEHEKRFVFGFVLDTRNDPFDGLRALEIDLEAFRPEDGRKANTRMLAGTIYVKNGRPVKHVGGKFGTEYWISNAPDKPSPFGYAQVNVSGARFFEHDPMERLVIGGQGKDPKRQTLAKVFINPNLHSHPPSYGIPVFPADQPSEGWGVQLPSKTSAAGEVKWGTLVVPQPDVKVGDRTFFRMIDTGRDLDGNIVVPEGGGGSLFVAHLMPGSRPAVP